MVSFFTSPRLRGEVGTQRSCEPGEGVPVYREVSVLRKSPSPQPSPRKNGQREKIASSFGSHQLRNFSLGQFELERVQRHRHHGVIAAQPDDLDDAALADQLYGVIVQRLRNTVAFVQ